MDALYFFLLLITVVGLVLVGTLVFGFSIRYRKERNPVATQIEGSTLLEATWTIIPLALFLIVFVWGALLYFRIYNPPANSMNIYIVGKQWMWKAEHPGGQHEINALHVPTGQPIQLTMISQDVFHSFSIPDFRIKREVIPGRYSTVWFEATTPGTYHIFCTQYCGTKHSRHDRRGHGADSRGLQEVDRGARPAACRWRRTASGCLPAWAAMPATPAMRRRAGRVSRASTARS